LIFDHENRRDEEKERWQILVLFRLGVNVNLSVGYVAVSVDLCGIIE